MFSENLELQITVGYSNNKLRKVELVGSDTRNITLSFPVYREKHLLDYSDEFIITPIAQRLRTIIPIQGFSPMHCVLDKEPVMIFSTKPIEGSTFYVPVSWRIKKPSYINMWHFVHETTEINLKTNYGSKPRWLVEGVAQLAAFIYFRKFHPSSLPLALRYYDSWGTATLQDYFLWKHKHFSFDDISNVSEPLKALLDWANTEHDEELEHKLYATALELFSARYGDNASIFDIFKLLDTVDGISKIAAAISDYE